MNEWQIVNENITPLEGWQLISAETGGGHSFLIEYYKRCRSGEIIIGRELKTTLEMLIQDIFDPAHVFTFDVAPAHKRINFIEKELKHFEAPFAGKPFIMTIEQKAFAEAVFGFMYFDPELSGGGRLVRRFHEVLFLVARKNGKTPLIAALTLAEWFCGEMGQKVMCASNDYEQAGLVFDCINAFREESRTVLSVTRKNIKGIFFGNPRQKKKTGKFSQQNKSSIKKMSAKMGAKEGRNLKTVVVDEVHEMKDDSTVAPLRSSLTTQDEPLYFEITSEGVVVDGYLDKRLDLARKCLRGEEKKPRWLIWLYTQDDEREIWNNPRSWVKSNPLLGVAKKISNLRDLVEEARTDGTKRPFTLAKEFNYKSKAVGAWLDDELVEIPDVFELSEFRGAWALVAVDLAETNDLCAVTYFFMKPNSAKKYYFTMYFVTEAKANDPNATESPTNTEKKDYRAWAANGYCRIVKGNVIDDEAAADFMREIYDKFKIRPFKIGYDEWHAKNFIKKAIFHFGDKVYNTPLCVNVRMTANVLNVPMRTLELDLRAHNVNYGGNEICKWCFKNTAVRCDKDGFVMPMKRQGYIGNKIDGTVTKIIINAVHRQYKAEFTKLIGGEGESAAS